MTDAPAGGDGGRGGAGGDEVRIVTGRVTGETTAAVESASVVLVRDGGGRGGGGGGEGGGRSDGGGLQLFMLERHVESDFAGGALVFPGGKVDDADRTLPPDRWTGLDLDAAAARMEAPPDLVLGWHVAAVRESFEEAGFLLAVREDGTPVVASDLASPSFAAARERLASRDRDWDLGRWLADEGLVLDLGALAWWSWWITPHGLHKRYTTRFFVAAVPGDQVGAHDEVETVSSRWIAPADALAAAERGEVTVIYPTRMNLRELAAYPSAGAVLEAARQGTVDRRPHLPEIVREGERVRIRHPYTGELDEP